jgi:hypothetical protein
MMSKFGRETTMTNGNKEPREGLDYRKGRSWGEGDGVGSVNQTVRDCGKPWWKGENGCKRHTWR